MKHAGAPTFDRLEDLLVSLRGVAGLKERSRGVFYLHSKPFLHFHDDPSGIHADLRIGDDFVRFRAETKVEQRALLARARQTAGGVAPSGRESGKTKAAS